MVVVVVVVVVVVDIELSLTDVVKGLLTLGLEVGSLELVGMSSGERGERG